MDILAPAQTAASVAFDAVNTGNIKARLIAEYQITLAAEVAYPAPLVLSSSTDKQPGVDPPTIKITALGSGKGGSVWKSPVFDQKDVPFTINGSPYTAKITDGSAEVVYSGEETADYRIDADFSGLEGNFMAVTPAAVSSARPVIAPPPPGIDYRPLIAILILLVIALLLIFLLERRRAARQKAVSSTGVAPAKKKTSKPRFTGKLNIYVTHMPDDTDVPPKTFSLYRENREKMRLHYVFLMCQLSLRGVDDDKIILRPGADGALSISNNSDSTVLKNRDLMMKGRTFLVHYEEKVTITFDNGSEVVLHYKNVKPSERV